MGHAAAYLAYLFLGLFTQNPTPGRRLNMCAVDSCCWSSIDGLRPVVGSLSAGLELMDTMGSLQEAAYERLCRWCGRLAFLGGRPRWNSSPSGMLFACAMR
jgi:hypothetical protein